MYYVYFIKLKNGDVYTGSTGDLRRRMFDHNLGKVSSTKHKRPHQLIGYEGYKIKSDGLRREKFLKTTEGKRLFRQQYRDILKSI